MDFFARRRPCAYVPETFLLSIRFWRLAALLVMALPTLAAGAANQLKVLAPTYVHPGSQFSFVVEAFDSTTLMPDPNYTGTIAFTVTDTAAPTPPNYTFTAADQGVHTFQLTMFTNGGQSIGSVDTVNTNISGGTTVFVSNGSNSTTTVMSSPNPSTYGQVVNFTITVSGGAGPIPQGNALYFDNGRFVGSAPLTSGQATVPANQISAGNHVVTVQYSGDITYAASTSNPLTQTVNK